MGENWTRNKYFLNKCGDAPWLGLIIPPRHGFGRHVSRVRNSEKIQLRLAGVLSLGLIYSESPERKASPRSTRETKEKSTRKKLGAEREECMLCTATQQTHGGLAQRPGRDGMLKYCVRDAGDQMAMSGREKTEVLCRS